MYNSVTLYTLYEKDGEVVAKVKKTPYDVMSKVLQGAKQVQDAKRALLDLFFEGEDLEKVRSTEIIRPI